MQKQYYDALGPDENSENKIWLCFIGIPCSKNLNILFAPDGLYLLILKYCYNRARLKLIINRGNAARVRGIHERPDTSDLYRSGYAMHIIPNFFVFVQNAQKRN
jgi:hypothetical protein